MTMREGEMQLRDLYPLFILDKQGLDFDVDGIVKGMSKCQGVIDIVRRSKILNNRDKSGRQTGDYEQMAECLIQAHLQHLDVAPHLQKLKEDIVYTYIKNTLYLLKLVTQTRDP